jgi:hypothetical protein
MGQNQGSEKPEVLFKDLAGRFAKKKLPFCRFNRRLLKYGETPLSHFWLKIEL